MEKNKGGAPTGNQNAAKAPEDKKDSFLYIRCSHAQKARWVHAANGPLASWVAAALDAQAVKEKRKKAREK